jgi:hypothetical protein
MLPSMEKQTAELEKEEAIRKMRGKRFSCTRTDNSGESTG